jgi:hypothetical protein
MNLTLLSALPHSRLEVENALLDPRKDYVRSILRGYATPADEIWLEIQPVLETEAKRLFRTCQHHNVGVVLRAGRTDLAIAARTSDVIVVLAHWKPPEVATRPNDILTSPSNMRGPLRQCVEQRILPEEKMTANLEAMHERTARATMAGWLNDAIDRWKEWLPYDDLVGAEMQTMLVSSAFGRNYARSIIDEIFGDENLLPGARLELADGLWRPDSIAGCFPDGWRGICDFFCCTSEYLAEEAKCLRPIATFRADSRCLLPAKAFAALGEMIPRLRHGTTATGRTDGFVSLYMKVAYDCDSKFGGN